MLHQYSLSDLRAIPIFFIVGKGRSGTTLLSTILDSHPKVASATESRFLLLVWQRYKNLKTWKPEMAEELIETVLSDFRVEFHWEFNDGLLSALEGLPPETKAQDLIKLIYIFKKSFFQKEKVEFIIDKNPRYTYFVDLLHSIFNEAKFIRIIRDPRDNVTSSVKYNNNRADSIAYKWRKYNQLLDLFEEKKGPITTLRFEDLVLDKVGFFEKFENYTGIDSLLAVEGKRLNIKEKFEEKLSESHKKQHAASVKPMDKSKIGHYQKKLTEKQIQMIEAMSFPYAEKFGYETSRELQTLPFKRRLKLAYKFLYNKYGNLLIYNLPYSALLWARNFVLTYIMTKKLDRYKSMSIEQ